MAWGACRSRCAPKLSPLQALKYECYLDSPLVRFLMKRAICDLKITHYFFWWVWGVQEWRGGPWGSPDPTCPCSEQAAEGRPQGLPVQHPLPVPAGSSALLLWEGAAGGV